MNESIESDNSRSRETVRGFLDEILDCVETETNRIQQLRGLAQRVVDDLIREAIDARDIHDSGAGDVDSLRAWIHNQQVLYTEQRQIVEGQFNVEPDLQNVFNTQHVTSNITRTRSLTLLSTCFNSNTVEPTDIKPSPSSISLSALTFTKERHDSDRLSNNLVCSQSYDSSNVNEDIDASNNTKDIREYPRYEKMKTVKTSRGELKVPAYCVDDMDEIELDRKVPESKKIMCTRKQKGEDTQNESSKKKGFCSRVKKFFRRMCCCSVQEEE